MSLDDRKGLSDAEQSQVNSLLGVLSDEWFVGFNGQRYWAFKYYWQHGVGVGSLGGDTLDALLSKVSRYEGTRLTSKTNC